MEQTMFDKDFMRKLEQIALTTKLQIKGGTGGNRKSAHKGSSVEFSDFRDYVFGDDFRHIDWNAYARFEKLFVKLFMEERETIVTIFLDCSKSMDFGENNKGILAKKLTAVFAYIALSKFDKVAICAINSKLQNNLKPFSGKQGFLKVLDFLNNIRFEGNTNLSNAITKYPAVSGRGGISIILSDLFSEDGYKDALNFLKYKNQEVTVINILSEEEINPQLNGSLRLIDSESKEIKELIITPNIIKEYKKVLTKFLNECREFCYGRSINNIVVQSDASLEEIVFNNLVKIGVVK